MKYVLHGLDNSVVLPMFFVLIFFELITQFVTKRQFYRLNDTFSSLVCGLTQQITGKLITTYLFAVLPYSFVFHIIYGGTQKALLNEKDITS